MPPREDSAAMSENIQFRSMRTADLVEARRLWSESEGVELAEGDSIGELMRYLSRNPEASQVAVAGSRLVGAVLAGHDGRRGLLYHLAVAKSHRGLSIGRELTTRSIEVLQRCGVRRVLILVARDNDMGREFWLKQGWEVLAFAEPMGLDI